MISSMVPSYFQTRVLRDKSTLGPHVRRTFINGTITAGRGRADSPVKALEGVQSCSLRLLVSRTFLLV